ncbi:hypothetical protein LX36DRAFT_582577 [Colletotrichum falcatum]|nr:hypothetical protein LX36DRAFT_582577 [Colletotrichum falcatum]
MSSEQDYQDLFGPQAKKAKRGRQQLQTDKSANAIRIRDNQRRSRARHKEFVDELQRKVQEYEKRGIEASLQMQKAARDVAIENSRLRALLASRGVSSDQVDAYLRSFDDDPKGSAAAAISINTTLAPILSGPVVLEPSPTQLPPLQEHFAKTFSPDPPVAKKRKYGDALLPPVLTLTPTPDVQQSSALDRLAVLADASLNRSSTQQPAHAHVHAHRHSNTPSESSRSPHSYDRTSQTPPRPAETQRHHQEQHPQPQHHHQHQHHQHLPAVSPHEMSCNAAARIIADMQGVSADDRKTKIALGCRPQDDECFVKNTSIFRVLDHR